jgi:hypothetical protein
VYEPWTRSPGRPRPLSTLAQIRAYSVKPAA